MSSDLQVFNLAIINCDDTESYGTMLPKLYEEMFEDFLMDLQSRFEEIPTRDIKLLKYSNVRFQFSFFNAIENYYPSNWNDYQAILIPGSKFSAFEDKDWIQKLKIEIRKIFSLMKPLIGICFGHQIIAEALGGKVLKNVKGAHIGIESTALNKDLINYLSNSMFENSESLTTIELLHSHADVVTTIPNGSLEIIDTNGSIFNTSVISCNLGSSDITEYSGLLIRDTRSSHPFIFTIQGHPDLMTKTGLNSYFIICKERYRTKTIDEAQLNSALGDMEKPLSSKVIGRLMIDLILNSELPMKF